uniref:Uncharacterized protein MANES_06G088800 n=1 Tax=Rhizophora mucronata TaxID=61149 RepID=A0A2P2PX13_RHIMU
MRKFGFFPVFIRRRPTKLEDFVQLFNLCSPLKNGLSNQKLCENTADAPKIHRCSIIS